MEKKQVDTLGLAVVLMIIDKILKMERNQKKRKEKDDEQTCQNFMANFNINLILWQILSNLAVKCAYFSKRKSFHALLKTMCNAIQYNVSLSSYGFAYDGIEIVNTYYLFEESSTSIQAKNKSAKKNKSNNK